MNNIIIDVGINQNRVGVLENNELVELYIEREDKKRTVGNIYKGRVMNVLPGMQAAFVDIGLKKNAFLYVKDALPREILENKNIHLKDISISDVLKQGEEIIVQVVKEPTKQKGARITKHITLPGRYLVFMPYSNYIGVSRRITDEEERKRLRELARNIKTNDKGLILRTVAEGKKEEVIKSDFEYLINLYKKIQKQGKSGVVPRVIYRDLDLIHRSVRDLLSGDTRKLIINDREKYESIVDFVQMVSPKLKSRVQFFDEWEDIFRHYGIDTKLKSALDRKVWLKSGGHIIIDETEALTSIDVNTGKYVGSVDLEHTVVKTNLEAAKEIAKQLRLRNIGGIIIIDFIDMDDKKDEQLVIKTLEDMLKKDRVRSTVFDITKLGLVEMTRKKNRNRISSKVLRKCPNCDGTGKVYSEFTILTQIEKEIKRIKHHTNAEAILLALNPFVCKVIEEEKEDYLDKIEKKYCIKIYIKPDDNVDYNHINVNNMGDVKKIKELYNLCLTN